MQPTFVSRCVMKLPAPTVMAVRHFCQHPVHHVSPGIGKGHSPGTSSAAVIGAVHLVSQLRKKSGRCPPSQRFACAQKQHAVFQSLTLPAIYYLYCLAFLGYTLALPLGPALAQRGLDIGTFTSCFFLGQLLGGIVLPAQSVRVGITPVMAGSLLAGGSAWGYLGYALQHNVQLPWILLARGIAGFGSGIIPVLKAHLASALPDKDQLSASLAYGEAAAQVAFTMVPFLGGAAADWFGLNVPFYFIACLCVGGAFLSLWAFPEQPRPTAHSQKSEEEVSKRARRRASICWSAWRTMGVSVVLSSVRFMMNPFIPFLLLRQYTFSTSTLGGVLSLLSTFIFICQVTLVQPLQRWIGVKQTCAAGVLSKAAALVLWGLYPSWIASALVLYALGLALAFAAMPGVVVETSPEERRGRFLVLEASISSFARIVSPLAIGMLHKAGSFTTLAVLLTCSCVLLL